MEPIDLAKARDLLCRAMETQGRDFVYARRANGNMPACMYHPSDCDTTRHGDDGLEFDTDDPRRITGCLIGVALDLAGYTVPVGCALTIGQLVVRMGWPIDDRAVSYWGVAQREQDDGRSWGYAYDRAELYAIDHLGAA